MYVVDDVVDVDVVVDDDVVVVFSKSHEGDLSQAMEFKDILHIYRLGCAPIPVIAAIASKGFYLYGSPTTTRI